MSDIATLQPIIRRMVREGHGDSIKPHLWATSYEHVPGTDITAAGIVQLRDEAIADLEAERIIRDRPEAED